MYNFILLFLLYIGSHIRFDAKTASKAMEWVEAVRHSINAEQERERQRVSYCILVMIVVFV